MVQAKPKQRKWKCITYKLDEIQSRIHTLRCRKSCETLKAFDLDRLASLKLSHNVIRVRGQQMHETFCIVNTNVLLYKILGDKADRQQSCHTNSGETVGANKR